MSHPVNIQILEDMGEQFEIALHEGDYLSCREIVAKLRSMGFASEANECENEINNAPVGEFTAFQAAQG